MSRQQISRLGLCLVTALLLSACGWHLRGVVDFGQLKAVSLEGGSSSLQYILRQRLQDNGVAVYRTANTQLHLLRESWSQRTVAVDSRGREAAIQLNYSLDWQLQRKDAPASPVRHIRLSSNVNQDPTNATAASEELDFSKAAMRREAIQQLMRQLHSLTQQPPDDTHATAP